MQAATAVPGVAPDHPVALVGGFLHTMSASDDVPDSIGTLVIEQGRIAAVGAHVELPPEASIVDVTGRHIYPGLFQADTDLGLIEINAVRATLDQQEVGAINPNVQAAVAVNPDSELIPVTRSNGVLLTLTVPQGPLIQGSSVVLQLDGWTWEDMSLRSPAGIHVQWPVEPGAPAHDADDEEGESDGEKAFDTQMRQLASAFTDARLYQQSQDARTHADDVERIPVDVRWEAMLPLLRREIPLIVGADDAVAIQQAVAFAVRQQVRLIIVGGYDAPECADLLKQFDIPVIVSAVYRLPRRRDDPFDHAYTLPERLRAAGIRFCIAGGGRFAAANSRNLPYHAATAVAYGLPHREALRAITLYPAQILGVADRVGSLEPGKDATLIVTNGDPLETATQVEQAFVQGKPVDLNNRHTQLWRKYQLKYQRLQSPSLE